MGGRGSEEGWGVEEVRNKDGRGSEEGWGVEEVRKDGGLRK